MDTLASGSLSEPAPQSIFRSMSQPAPLAEPDPTPALLANLAAAGLVSHELIGDPARFGNETAVLEALCAKVSGAVYRLGPFHYAFRLGARDVDGLLGSSRGEPFGEREPNTCEPGTCEPAAWGAALEAAFAAEFGAEAAWVSPADLVHAAGDEVGLDARQVLFLKAAGEAAAATLTEAPDLVAVINARFAALAAETTAALSVEAVERAAAAAEAERGTLAGRLDALAAGLERLEAGLTRITAAAETAAQSAAQSAVEAQAGALAAFESRLGLTLAELMAEFRAEIGAEIGARAGSAAAPARVVEIAPAGAPPRRASWSD